MKQIDLLLEKFPNCNFKEEEYKGYREYMKFTCNEHGEQLKKPIEMLKKGGFACEECHIKTFVRQKREKITKDVFLRRSLESHNGKKYTYLNIDQIDTCRNIKKLDLNIICDCGNEFTQNAFTHMRGLGCRLCGVKKAAIDRTMTKEQFIEKAKLIHGDKYDYSLIPDGKLTEEIYKIKCNECGKIIIQSTNQHLSGRGCIDCGVKSSILKRTMTKEEFIEKAKQIHGDKYDYSLVNYKNSKTKVKIVCNKHGEFLQTPNSHLSKEGCPYCSESRGERELKNFFDRNGFRYIRQKRFNECKFKNKLPFDFYLPDFRCLVEYQGAQHDYPVKAFGGEEEFEKRKIRDNIKKEFAQKNFNFIEIRERDLKKLNIIFDLS